MNKQIQYLFETPVTSEATLYTNPYSNPEWEAEWELPEVFPLNEEEWETVGRLKVPRRSVPKRPRRVPRSRRSSCPPVQSTQPRIVYGWGQYKQRVQELPPNQQAILRKVGDEIRLSYQPGCQPIRNVQVFGHADSDTPPNQPRNIQREKQMSDERALMVTSWLKNYVGNNIAGRITWDTQGFGATKLKAPPTTESNRKQNRRVEIILISKSGLLPIYKRGYLQVSYNRIVGSLGGLVHPLLTRSQNKVMAFRSLYGSIAGLPIANVREDVMNAMNRLHLLWSMSSSDYGVEYPIVASLPPGKTLDEKLIPLTINAIKRNQEPTIHHEVAKYFLNQPLSQPVGRNLPNLKTDVLMLQNSLQALRLLSFPDYNAERAAVTSLTTVTNPDGVIPKTLAAITSLKEKIASFQLGWKPLQADELEAGGDRFGGRTFDFTVTTLCYEPKRKTPAQVKHCVSIFIPRMLTSNTNNVHIFFSPGGAAENNRNNNVLVQGLRAAADSTNWILIGVSGVHEEVNSKWRDGWRTMNDEAIKECLSWAGRSPNISAVRLSGHSRGVLGLNQTLFGSKKSLISSPIERIFILDAPKLFSGRGKKVVVYHVNDTKRVPEAIFHELYSPCMEAIAYTRLIKNAMITRPKLSIPHEIQNQLLKAIPDRGCFSTAPKKSLNGCQKNIQEFCHENRKAITNIFSQVNSPNSLYEFCEDNNLLHDGTPRSFLREWYAHHLFVAEIAHELFRT
jgi:outer membrane protein OmpA-like peptidoglycan-associated protein